MLHLDEAKYKFCSTQINLNGTAATRVLMAADMLPDDVLGVEGREDQPHLTVQYGIQTPDVDAIRQAVGRVSPFEIVLGRTETFPATEHSSGDSPLFVSVKVGTDKLVALRNAIRAVVPVRDSFPTYVPHVCVAYVRTDEAQRYVGKDWLDGTVVVVSEIAFSNTEGEHVSIPLGRMSESTLVVGKINSLLDRLGEAADFSVYTDPEKFRVKFGDTSVEDHNRMAADFKASAAKHKAGYENRTSVKASGPSKYSNLRYYFDNAPEGKQYRALMTASRKHKKVADILTRGGRGSINEGSNEAENPIQQAMFDLERSIASQAAKEYAQTQAEIRYANSNALSKNEIDTYYRYYLNRHKQAVAFVKRLDGDRAKKSKKA